MNNNTLRRFQAFRRMHFKLSFRYVGTARGRQHLEQSEYWHSVIKDYLRSL